MSPRATAIAGAPDAAASALFRAGRVQGSLTRGMEDDRMAPVVACGDERLACPCAAMIARGVHPANAGIGIADAAEAQVCGIEGVNRDRPDAPADAGGVRRCQQCPGRTAV